MILRIHSFLALGTCGLLLGCAALDPAMDQTDLSDSAIASEVSMRLADDDLTGPYTFGILVSQGVVTLQGAIPRHDLRFRAVSIAGSTPGVVDVDDQLRPW